MWYFDKKKGAKAKKITKRWKKTKKMTSILATLLVLIFCWEVCGKNKTNSTKLVATIENLKKNEHTGKTKNVQATHRNI